MATDDPNHARSASAAPPIPGTSSAGERAFSPFGHKPAGVNSSRAELVRQRDAAIVALCGRLIVEGSDPSPAARTVAEALRMDVAEVWRIVGLDTGEAR